MTRAPWTILLSLFAAPVCADVQTAVTDQILPGFAQFSQAATALNAAAQSDCSPAQVQPAYQAAFDAWMAVADLRLGPSETGALSIAFWPDERGFTPKILSGLIADQDPIGRDPVAFAEVSIAGRGLLSLDMLLYDPDYAGYGPQDYACALVQTVAADLARQAAALETAWADGFAAILVGAGEAGNTTFATQDEAVSAIYTQILSSLELTADDRLGRPMGTFDRPRTRLAEAWRSGRSLRNVMLSVEAAQSLAHDLVDVDLPQTDAAVAAVLRAADGITDPAFQDIDDPQARFKVEVLQQAVRAVKSALETEIGASLGIAAGFNSGDGD